MEVWKGKRTLGSSGQASGLLSDLRLLRRMAAMLYQYWIVGGRLRREYRRREARGEVFWVDDSGSTRHREESLHPR